MQLFLVFLLSVVIFAPTLVFAQAGGLVPCDGPECDFGDLIALADNVLNFLIALAIPIAAVMFAYAGWLYLSAGGDSGKIKKAHEIFLAVAIGIVIVLGAWLIVNTILSFLTDRGIRERTGEFSLQESVDTAPWIG